MEKKWYNDALVYHIYSNNFKCAELEKWIPHIKGMGFNTVLFSPVLKSHSHGYDVIDYFQIDCRIGSNDEFKTLVQKFHENGIKIMLDSVFNHCGRDFFAFQELRNGNRNYASWFDNVDFSKQSPLGDYFNYSTWAGYYELPKLNLKNNAVKDYLLSATKFWLETFEIDGMRIDAADVLDFDFMKELRRPTQIIKHDFWLMGEVVHGDYSKWVNESTLHSVTNYSLYKSLFSSHNDNNLYELAHCLKSAVPNNGLPLYSFLDNHDQNRIASIIKNEKHLNSLYTLLFSVPGIPSIYYGSEWSFKGIKKNGSDAEIRPYIDIENRSTYETPLTAHISKLAQIRQRENALKYGSYKQLYLEYNQPFIFERCYENERIFVAVNVLDDCKYIDLNKYGCNGFTDLLSGEHLASGRIEIKPHSTIIIKEEK